MLAQSPKSNRTGRAQAALVILLALGLASPICVYGSKKKKADTTPQPAAPKVEIDTSKLVWPSPPDIARVRYLNYYAGMKIDYTPAPAGKKKQSWMDRVAGTKQADNSDKIKTFPFQLLGRTGLPSTPRGWYMWPTKKS